MYYSAIWKSKFVDVDAMATDYDENKDVVW